MRKQVLFMTILLILAGLFSSQAQNRMMRHGKAPILPDLTKDQKEKFDDLQYEHRKEVVELRSRIKLNRLELGKALRADSFDESRIRELISKNSDLQAQIKNSFVDMWLNVYNMLDENQKEAWKDRLLKMGSNDQMPRFGHKLRGMRGMGPEKPPAPDEAPLAPEAPDDI